MTIGLTIIKEPEDLALSRVPAWYRFQCNNFLLSAGTAAQFKIFVPNLIAAGSVFTLVINNKQYLFTCVASGAAGGYQFKTYSNNPTFNLMVDDFKANYYLNKHYTITSSYTFGEIYFVAKELGAKWDAAMINSVGGCTLTQTVTGVDDSFRPNYKALIDLHLQADRTVAPVMNLISSAEGDPHQDSITGALASDEYVMDFELQEFLHSRLSAYIPAYGANTITEADSILINYWIQYSEMYGTDPVINFNAVHGAANDYKQVILGGWKLDDNYLTENTAIAGTSFLNRQERVKIIAPNSREYLFKYCAAAQTGLQAHYKIYYADGFIAQGVLGMAVTAAAKKVYCVPVGYDVMSIAALTPGNKVIKYEIYLTNAANAVLTETMTYVMDYRYNEQDEEFIFCGAVGATETVWCHGYSKVMLETTSDTYQAARLPWYAKGDRLLKHTNSRQNETIKINTGYKTKAYIEWLRDLMNSDVVLMRDGSAWTSVRVVKDSFKDMPTLLDNMFVAEFMIERLQKL
jgi:hypothetical protein